MQNNTKCRKLRDKIINNFVDELRNTNFYQVDFKSSLERCLKELGERKVEQIVCYGLGSFHDGVDITSKFQLALLTLLFECLIEDQGRYCLNSVIEVYDPSFEQMDKDTLAMFQRPQFKLIDENEFCARQVVTSNHNRCHLFYMPHLDKYFYNNLIGSNWNSNDLASILVLGNSFKEMIENETTIKCHNELYYLNLLVNNFQDSESNRRGRKKDSPTRETTCMSKSVNAMIEIPIDDKSFQHSDIFNSLSFHLMSKIWLVDNAAKIERARLAKWTFVTSQPPEDICDNDCVWRRPR